MNAVHNIHTHLNLNGNEVRNVRLERLPSDPDPVEGGVYFNLETREFRFSDGTAWESLLGGFWKLDDDGNLVTDKTVIIKKNLTIGGDMSTDGEGEGTVTGVTSIIIDGVPYFAEDGAIDLSEAFEGLDVDVDLSDYYTKSETTRLVNTAIANLVNGAPETLDTLKEVADALAENADVVDALNAAIGDKADKATTLAGYGITDAYTRTEIDTKYSPVKTWYDDLASLIVKEGNNVRIKTNIIIDGDQSAGGEGGQGTVTGVTSIIIDGVSYFAEDGAIDLSEAFEGLDIDIDLSDYYTKNETIDLVNGAIADLVNGAPTTLDTLKEVADALAENADVVDALNAAIGNKADKATTLAGYGITDAYTRTEIDTKYSPVKTWYDDLASLIVKEGNNVRIKTNIVIDGDQSATGEGGGGTVIGITGIAVNGQTYTDTNNDGIIDLGTISGGGDIDLSAYLTKTDAQNTYLAKSGGTIESTSSNPLKLISPSNNWLMFRNTSGYLGEFGFTTDKVAHCTDASGAVKIIIHSGNIGSQTVSAATKLATARTIWGQSFDGTGNVSGSLNIGASSIFMSYNSNDMSIVTPSAGKPIFGYGTAAKGYDTYVDGYKIHLRYGASHTEGLLLSESGNVLIGTTDNSGYKLDVNGTARFGTTSGCDVYFKRTDGYNYLNAAHSFAFTVNNSTRNIAIAIDTDKTAKFYGAVTMSSTLSVGGSITPSGGGKYNLGSASLWFERIYGRYIDTQSGYNLRICVAGTEVISIGASSQNVGIDNTNPQYKLDVNGIARATGWIGSNVNISCDSNGNTSGYGGEINRFGGGKLWIQAREGGLELGNSAGINFNGAVTMSSKLTIDTNTYLQGGSNNPYLKFSYGSSNWYLQAYTTNGVAGVFLGSTSSKSLKVDATGNVSIQGNLVVAGDISA